MTSSPSPASAARAGDAMLAAVTQVRESRGARLRRRLLQRASTRAALALLGFMVLAALLAPWVATHDPMAGGNDALLPPLSPGYWLGTDDLGRDIWSRVVHGTRVSLLVGIASSALAVSLGVTVGALAGYFGGWLDAVLMRVAEFFQTLPRFVLALIVIALFGASTGKLILVIGLLAWPQMARVVRATVASLKQAPFVDAARVGLDIGAPDVLARYAGWRRVDTMSLLAVTDALNRLFSNDIPALRLARDIGLAAVDRIAPLKRLLMRHAMGVVGDLPRLVRGEPL